MNHHVNLSALAHEEMLAQGFHPDFSQEVRKQVVQIQASARKSPPDVRDLRALAWSSIDNDTSRDLDQIEVAESLPDGAVRIRVAIADVDSSVPKDSPIDRHADSECTSVYTGVVTFPMLPEELSTDLTSLNENEDRLAMVIEFAVAKEGSVTSEDAYLAMVRNRAQLAYPSVGAWLEGKGDPPPKIAASKEIEQQLKIQDDVAQRLRDARFRAGALDFDSIETQPILSNGQVMGLHPTLKNRATELIEDFMVTANGVIARKLKDVPSIRRVVKTPERWNRIVDLAASLGEHLPSTPDSLALNAFLTKRRKIDPVHSPDLSLSIIKLMGPGEYIVERAGEVNTGHFGLAVYDYTHSTAPNRRYADLVTERVVKALLAKRASPYSEGELENIARNCTLREDTARKVERSMRKRIAAVALRSHIGQTFAGVVTGASEKGTFVRIFNPPAEGLLVHGAGGLDVGDRLQVKLVDTNPQRGFIDFARQ